MKTSLKSLALLFALPICALANFPSPAAADSTADLILSLKCGGGYNVNIWRNYKSGELLYRSTSPNGDLSLGRGTRDDTGAAQVYQFKNGIYKYQVLGGKRDHQGEGNLEVYKNNRSIMSQTCKSNQ